MDRSDFESRAEGLRWRDVIAVLAVISVLTFTVARLAVHSPRSFFKFATLAEAEATSSVEAPAVSVLDADAVR